METSGNTIDVGSLRVVTLLTALCAVFVIAGLVFLIRLVTDRRCCSSFKAWSVLAMLAMLSLGFVSTLTAVEAFGRLR